VDVRIVAATNRPLEDAIKDGSLRQDLFYRLNVVRIRMPPLRERKDDIPALVAYFLRQLNQRFSREVTGVAPEAMAALTVYDFPGNVRELEHLLERAYALGVRGEVTLADLPALSARTASLVTAADDLPTIAEMERELILRALRLHGNDKEQAAKALGLSRRTLYRRLKEYGLL
jgi:two-component system response regulator HydG/two-component system response regulator AtoC